MNDVELTLLSYRSFYREAFQIELALGEEPQYSGDVFLLDIGDDIDILGQPRFAVNERGYGSGNEIGNSVFAKATSGQMEEFTQIHGASCGLFLAQFDVESIPDGTFGERLEASVSPRSIVQDRFPGAAPALSSCIFQPCHCRCFRWSPGGDRNEHMIQNAKTISSWPLKFL